MAIPNPDSEVEEMCLSILRLASALLPFIVAGCNSLPIALDTESHTGPTVQPASAAMLVVQTIGTLPGSGGGSTLLQMDASGGITTQPVESQSAGVGSFSEPAWDPDGAGLVGTFGRRGTDGDVSGGLLHIRLSDQSETAINEGEGIDRCGDVSATGSLAFVRAGSASAAGVYLSDLGAAPHLIWGLPEGIPWGAGCPRWSPDGTRLALVDDHRNLLVIAQDGSVLRNLGPVRSDLAAVSIPAWSPSGEWIAVADAPEGGQVTIWAARVATGERTQLVTMKGDLRDPDWSPDGSLIAFTHNNWEGTISVALASSDGTGARDLIVGNRPRFNPKWRPARPGT